LEYQRNCKYDFIWNSIAFYKVGTKIQSHFIKEELQSIF
jgi:hypothetical protein